MNYKDNNTRLRTGDWLNNKQHPGIESLKRVD